MNTLTLVEFLKPTDSMKKVGRAIQAIAESKRINLDAEDSERKLVETVKDGTIASEQAQQVLSINRRNLQRYLSPALYDAFIGYETRNQTAKVYDMAANES